MDNDTDIIEVEGHQVTLADLAGFDMADAVEKRFFRAPLGLYAFEVIPDDLGPPQIRNMNGKAAIIFPCKITNVLGVKDPEFTGDPMKLIGEIHQEMQFITNSESYNYILTFLVDIGVTGRGKLSEMLARSVGIRFQAPIVHRPDPNDTSKIYVSIRRDRIIKAVQPAASQAA